MGSAQNSKLAILALVTILTIRRSTRCPRSSNKSTVGAKSTSTVASCKAPILSKPWLWVLEWFVILRRYRFTGTFLSNADGMVQICQQVFVGRPVLWGLAHSGEEGVGRIIDILKMELDLAMALSGNLPANKINEFEKPAIRPFFFV